MQDVLRIEKEYINRNELKFFSWLVSFNISENN